MIKGDQRLRRAAREVVPVICGSGGVPIQLQFGRYSAGILPDFGRGVLEPEGIYKMAV